MGCCCEKASYDVAGNRISRRQLEELQGSIRFRGRHVIKVFAQVLELVQVFGGEESDNVMETNIDDEDQFDWLWHPMCDVPVHVSLACIKEGQIYEYTVYAEENEICPLNSTITIPGTEIKKTGIYFIQWKDPYTGNVYGLNFFTEQEALRFLSSCFPPTFTPDAAIRTASSRPSYTCPSPPRSVCDLPLLGNISSGKGSAGDQSTSKHEHRCSTPEQEAEEFFRMVLGPIKPLHTYTVKTKDDNQEKMIENSPSSSSIDQYLAILPKSDSIMSNLDNERPLSGSFPSPPSQFDQSSKSNTEENTDGESVGNSQVTSVIQESNSKINDRSQDNGTKYDRSCSNETNETDDDESEVTCIDDVELYQPGDGPIEFNKILADIPEEEDEEIELSLSSSSRSVNKKRLVRMDAIDTGGVRDSKMSLAQLSDTMSSGSLDSTALDFDRLLQDLQESDLLEITQTEQKQQGLSRQTSFAGPPPGLPHTLPPGPTLSPYSSISDMEGDFDTTDFKNALKHLSITSLENVYEIPKTYPPGIALSPRQSLSDVNRNSAPQEKLNNGQLLLPPTGNDNADHNPLKRHPSFLRYHYNPPEEFSSDSGVSNTTDTEDNVIFTHRQSQLLEALRVADLENKMKASSPSTSPPSEKTESNGDSNWIMASKPIFGRETSSRTSTIRKSGWLEVKVLLVRKNKKVAMKSRRRWKKYWAILKGVNLLLYKWNSETLIMDDTPCDTKLDINGCLAYPVTNHMKRDHLFSLSTSTGNTYYMEAICQSAVDEWIQELHIACALAITSQTTREKALEEIVKQISSTEESIVTERRMKNMAELQLTSVPGNKTSIIRQIDVFAEDIDRLNVELYRMKCYQSSLRGVDLPNPQSILGVISKQTKTIVSKIGIFSVGSLQSVMSTRFTKPVDTRSLSSRTSFKELSTAIEHHHYQQQHNIIHVLPRRKEKRGFSLFSSSTKTRRHLKFSSPIISNPLSAAVGEESDPHLLTYRQILEPDPLMTGFGSVLTVELQTGQICEVPFKIDLTVSDIILHCCKKCGLDPSDHFLLVKEDVVHSDYDATIPGEEEFINNLSFKYLSIRQKFIRTVYFHTTESAGLVLKPDIHNLGAVTHALIGEVTPGSIVEQNGLMEGDEVVLINDMAVSHMSWSTVMNTIKEPSVTITVRTCRVNVPQSVRGKTTHVHLKDLVCPSPPTRGKKLSPEKLDNLIVPKPSDITTSYSFERDYDNKSMTSTEDEDEEEEERDEATPNESERVKQLIKDYSEVSKLVGIWKAYDEASFVVEDVPGMTPSQRIMKCVQEIITTEVEHVKMLEVLVDRYLEPMQQEKFLPREKMSFITANIQGVVVQQKQFKGRIEVIPQVYSSKEPQTIKALLQELCGSVEVHLDTFRQYSQFYAAQHELDTLFNEFQDKQRLNQFLAARNPNQDPNFSLTNLLSKPVLRLVRYPLFFKALRDQMDKTSEESTLLDGIISSLLKVTEYINEVQRVTESYINLFDQLLEESRLAEFGVSVRVSQLLTHVTVMWLNAKGPGMNKSWRKGQGPETNCFVFETVLVILCLEKTSSKRKTSKASIREGMITTGDLLYSVLLPLAQCKANNLPDSDGVTAMWQIVHKDRQLNSKPNTYIFRSKNLIEKSGILDLINLAISDQLALYGGMSGSKSPTMSSISAYGSPFRGRNHSFISQLTKTDSVDSEYELTLL